MNQPDTLRAPLQAPREAAEVVAAYETPSRQHRRQQMHARCVLRYAQREAEARRYGAHMSAVSGRRRGASVTQNARGGSSKYARQFRCRRVSRSQRAALFIQNAARVDVDRGAQYALPRMICYNDSQQRHG